MLDEVGDAVDLRGFITGAGADPGAHGDAPDLGHGLGKNEEAVGQNGLADVAWSVLLGGRVESIAKGSRVADMLLLGLYCFIVAVLDDGSLVEEGLPAGSGLPPNGGASSDALALMEGVGKEVSVGG